MRLLPLVPLAIALVLTAGLALAQEQPRDLRAELSALVKKGDDGALLRAADEILGQAPQSLVALEFRAYALQRMGRLRDARLTYESLLGLDSDHVWALTRLGAMHADERRWEAALIRLRRAVEVSPGSSDAQRELIGALRGSGDLLAAQEAALAVRTADATAGWAWRAEAELAWTRGDIDAAVYAMRGAHRVGTKDMARLSQVIDLDARLLAAADDPESLRAAWANRHVWTFEVRGIQVRSSVGPRLPGDLVRMLRELPARFRELVGDDRRERPPVVLRLSRTLDEHERLRRVLYPMGSVGRAFTTTASRGGRRGGSRDVAIYVAWTSDDVHTALAHELAHAAMRDAARVVPLWLDEGSATYLETLRHGTDEVGLERDALEAPLREALRDDRTLAWPRMLAAQRPDFEGADGRLRYAQAWSMIRFLLQHPAAGADTVARRGRFARLVRTAQDLPRGPGRGGWADWKASLESIYETPLEALESAWRESL